MKESKYPLLRKFAEIPDHPRYGVNALGEVINFKTGRILKVDNSAKGYGRVQLDGAKYYIHKLVASVFVDNPKGWKYVIHKDGNPANNIYTNLSWTFKVRGKSTLS